MNASRRRIGGPPGFTLVEMLLVITIMAIMVGSIAPNFSGFMAGQTLKNAARIQSTILRFARSMAVERSAVVRVTYNQETGDILLEVESDPINMAGVFESVTLPVAYPAKYKQEVMLAQIEKDALSGTLSENELEFQPDGTTSDTFIRLMDQNENIYTIGVVGLTGQIMVWKGMAQSFYD